MRLRGNFLLSLVTLPMAQASGVEERLRAVLEKTIRRGGLTWPGKIAAVLLMLASLAALTAFHMVSDAPATLSAVTPVSQDGFTLLAIQRGNGSNNYLNTTGPEGSTFRHYQDSNVGDGVDGTVLWIKPPLLPRVSAPVSGTEYHVQGRSSTGTRFWLPSVMADNGLSVGGLPPLLCVALPPGYPNSYRYVDVTVSDQHGHQACWRLMNLPKMRHVLAPPIKLTWQISRQGFTIKAHAWRYFDRRVPVAAGMSAGFDVLAVPAASFHYWDMVMYPPIAEWQSENASMDTKSNFMTLASPLARGPSGDFGIGNPYAQDTHYSKIELDLRQFEMYDEPVIFHNIVVKYIPHSGRPPYCIVNMPQSVTTPSGVTVTLPVLSQTKQIGMPWVNGGTDCEYQVSTPEQPVFLAHSPLCQRYHLPVSVQVTVPLPYHNSGNESLQGSAMHILSYTGPKPYSARLSRLTLIVRQRVDLQTIPLNFVVPVQNAPPLNR